MQVTTREMRKNVKGWLIEEMATAEQALQLLDALYAGAIAGAVYNGRRSCSEGGEVISLVRYNRPSSEKKTEIARAGCGCLLGTFEDITTPRETSITGSSRVVFGLATYIHFGDTPSTSTWARAAARGIEDYLATLDAEALCPA